MKENIRYTESEYNTILMHIERYFGEIVQIYSGSLANPDNMDRAFVDLDLCLIAPTPERNYYTFVTIGFGAFKMPVPRDYLRKKLSRAELCFALPPETDFSKVEVQDLWPMKMMNSLVYHVVKERLWIGWGNTFFDGDKPFSENTKLGSIMLVSPGGDNPQVCVLPNDEEVNFYCLLPLYKEEVEYVRNFGQSHLLDRFVSNEAVLNEFKDVPIINEKRPNVCLDTSPKKEELKVAGQYYIGDVIDYAGWHKENIEENDLPVDEIQTYNHIAIYLRFAIENDLMSDDFLADNMELVDSVLYNTEDFDLREYIEDFYSGCLLFEMFSDRGFSFASYYYNKLATNIEDELHSYTADIDNFAQEYFKDDWEYLPEQKRYAYLFIPYNESYYQAMSKKITKRYNDWKLLYDLKKQYIMS